PTFCYFFFFQAEDGIRDFHVTGVQTCALPISASPGAPSGWSAARTRTAEPCTSRSATVTATVLRGLPSGGLRCTETAAGAMTATAGRPTTTSRSATPNQVLPQAVCNVPSG